MVQAAPTFHDLRHSHASALIAAGWDIEEVSARLGHTSVATTQKIYVHEYDAARRSKGRQNRLQTLYGNGRRSSSLETRPVGPSSDQHGALARISALPAARD